MYDISLTFKPADKKRASGYWQADLKAVAKQYCIFACCRMEIKEEDILVEAHQNLEGAINNLRTVIKYIY